MWVWFVFLIVIGLKRKICEPVCSHAMSLLTWTLIISVNESIKSLTRSLPKGIVWDLFPESILLLLNDAWWCYTKEANYCLMFTLTFFLDLDFLFLKLLFFIKMFSHTKHSFPSSKSPEILPAHPVPSSFMSWLLWYHCVPQTFWYMNELIHTHTLENKIASLICEVTNW